MSQFKLALSIAVAAVALTSPAVSRAAVKTAGFRPPAVPLVANSPYLSIWSEADRLTDDATRHWTRREHALLSLIRVDGKAYRLMGNVPKQVPALPQVALQVLPTRSIYQFENAQVRVTLTFMTAMLPDDLEVLARPLSYITWQVRSRDGGEHAISIYDSTSSRLAVNEPKENVEWAAATAGDLTVLRAGTQEQPVLGSCGDDHRINWGYVYAVAPTAQARSAIGASQALLAGFVNDGTLPGEVDRRMPRASNDDEPVLAFALDLGRVGAETVARTVIVAYDEIYAIKYFGQKLRPYWRRNGAQPADLFRAAHRDYPLLARRCAEFDRQLMADMTRVGGARYAQIAALAYREALAACGLAADAHKQPLLFTKENTSNGDIATVDVFYPMDPMLILLSPTLAKASLVHVLAYAASPHWKFPNAPHDLGTYPIVMGRDDGGEGMPVEESGNMLLLCDAIAQAEGKADFVAPWWPQLTQWAHYLENYGLDPENQLCTDDFMGHLAHNANLSVKAILGLAAYGDLCRMRGETAQAEKYRNLAKADARHWLKAAAEGDHSRLAFDQPKTWSQKYNLAWDRILGLNVFPPSVARQEIAFYKTVMQPYGLPLDSRTRLTKTDWSVWTAALAEEQADFEALVAPIYDYLNETTARDPLADSYVTNDKRSGGMHARPVVGGIFIKMLADPAVWKKWAAADRAKVGDWAPLPPPPKTTVVVPTSQHQAVSWRYTIQKPADRWTEPAFDDSGWKSGPGGFGTRGTPGAVIGTVWNTDDIWLRREITMPEGSFADLQFLVYHDEDVEIYVNGVLAATENGFRTEYVLMDIRRAAKALLKPGAKITLAVHCHQTEGGQGVDVGLVNVVQP
ncbi:MAG: DUF5127 domain-containing protein [Thermoguttaceae bacterium]|jgi:hypothetical protein